MGHPLNACEDRAHLLLWPMRLLSREKMIKYLPEILSRLFDSAPTQGIAFCEGRVCAV